MTIPVVFFAALVLAAFLHWRKGWWWLSASAPVVGFVAVILVEVYVLPYQGGGASMWPLAILFGAPIALGGALCGMLIGHLIRKAQRGTTQAR